MEYKKCTKCGKTKPLFDFHKDKQTSDGVRNSCKDCVNKARVKRYNDNPEHGRAVNKKSRLKSENKIKRNKYQIKWRSENKEHLTEYNKRYRLPEEIKQERRRKRNEISIINKDLRKNKLNDLKLKQSTSYLSKYNKSKFIVFKEWKYIDGFDDKYMVSNYGDVYSKIRNRLLTQFTTTYGYLHVNLYKNGKQIKCKVHRLVAKAFIPNIDNKPHINHIDMDRTNNCINNLEWVTPLENNLHKTYTTYIK